MKRIMAIIGLLLGAAIVASPAGAEEKYANVTISPAGWTMREMQTFSGSVPSRAWVFGQNDEEVLISVLITEGIVGGLEGQDYGRLAKLYVEAFVGGWGGKADISESGQMAAGFCGGRPGYKTKGHFGDVTHDYYGCIIVSEDFHRVVTAVTWQDENAPESAAARRLISVLQGVVLPKPE